MSCCGKHKTMDGKPAPNYDAHDVRPTEECVFCAEKHLATAYALAQEKGYEAVNRYRLYGELVEAQWHIWRRSLPLAEKLRELRHLAQMRKDISAEQWREAIRMMDEITTAEVAAMERK
jgi:hypothetical protein